VISVSATQPEDEFSNWSSYGPKVDVSAPGSSVLTTNCYACTYADHDTWGTHTYISGTSFATPNVAGVVALLRAAYPAESPAQIVDRLVAGTDDLGFPGWDNRYGTGRVNALRSLGVGVSAAALAAGDAWEGNNVIGTARSIQPGVTFRPSIHPAGDVDWFRVQVPRAGRLEVRATGIVDNRAYPWNKSGLPIDPIIGLYTTSGTLLRVVDNEWEGGTELASYSFAEATTVAIRISNWYPNGNPGSYTLSTAFVDEVPPRVMHLVPGPNAEMVLPRTRITFDVSEPVTGIDASTVTLVTLSGRSLAAHVTYTPSSGHVTVVPDAPLPSDTTIVLRLSTSIQDSAGLTFAYQGYRFRTMPGTTWLPSRAVRFSPGTNIGHRIGAGGQILGLRSGRLTSASGASSPQRAVLPNLPGAWLYIENGMWAGTWIREGARAFVAGTTEVRALSATTRLTFLAGVRMGRSYAENGSVTSTKTVTITRTSGANTDALAIINGIRHYHVTNGLFAGRWVAESTGIYRAGIVDRMSFSPIRRIQVAAGTHAGVTLASNGRIIGWMSQRLARTSGASVSAWAVVNGVPRVLVTNGIWAGMWLPAEDVLAYEH
jgi:hypothetical protein